MKKIILALLFLVFSACNTINISVGKGTAQMEQDTQLRDTGVKADVDARENTIPVSAMP